MIIHNKVFTIPNFFAGFATIWGFWVMLPFWDMFTYNPKIYTPMLSIVPYEFFWGALFFSAGLSALFMNIRKLPRYAAMTLCVIFAFFSSLYFIGEPLSVSWVLYGYISLAHFIIWGTSRWTIKP